MADVPAVTTPVSDDVELEDILRRSTPEVPAVVVREDSISAPATGAAAGADDGARLSTPAPMATFEMLSDVEESDMDDISSLGAQRDGMTLDAESHVKSLADETVTDDTHVQANGTEADDAMDLSDTQNKLEDRNDVDLIASEHAASQDWSTEPIATAAGVPTLVFEDVDAGKPTNLNSPDECLVNNDDVNDVNDDTQQQQQQWQWAADQDQGNFLSRWARLHVVREVAYDRLGEPGKIKQMVCYTDSLHRFPAHCLSIFGEA